MAVVGSALVTNWRHLAQPAAPLSANASVSQDVHSTMSRGCSDGTVQSNPLLRSGPLTRESLTARPNNTTITPAPLRQALDFPLGAPPRLTLDRVTTTDSYQASILTDGSDFSTSSTVNRGYTARIDVNGKVTPLSSTPARHACQTIAFLEGPSDSLDYKTYRPGDEIKGAVHLLRNDPERGIITGIDARIRGDLERVRCR